MDIETDEITWDVEGQNPVTFSPTKWPVVASHFVSYAPNGSDWTCEVRVCPDSGPLSGDYMISLLRVTSYSAPTRKLTVLRGVNPENGMEKVVKAVRSMCDRDPGPDLSQAILNQLPSMRL